VRVRKEEKGRERRGGGSERGKRKGASPFPFQFTFLHFDTVSPPHLLGAYGASTLS